MYVAQDLAAFVLVTIKFSMMTFNPFSQIAVILSVYEFYFYQFHTTLQFAIWI